MKRNVRVQRWRCYFLIGLGCLQFAGYFFNSRIARRIGFSYGASPLPTVFSTVGGVEGFSCRHTLYYTNASGNADSLFPDQRSFGKFKGSYLLKNAYSIFLAYPHMLHEEEVSSGINYMLSENNLKKEFGISGSIKDASTGIDRTWYRKHEKIILNPTCNDK